VPLSDAGGVTEIKTLVDGRLAFLARVGDAWELRLSAPAAPSSLLMSFPAGDFYPNFDVIR
jgi:hypothetical protein